MTPDIKNQIAWSELQGVTAPSLKTVYEGIRIAKENQVDVVIGIGVVVIIVGNGRTLKHCFL